MTQADPHTTTIAMVKYIMYPLPPLESNRLFIEFTKMIGSPVAKLIGAFVEQFSAAGFELKDLDIQGPDQMAELKEKFFAMDLKLGMIDTPIKSLLEQLDPDYIEKLIKELAPLSVAEGHGQLDKIFDLHFRGDLGNMYKWLIWGVGVQWGNLLGVLSVEKTS